MRVKSIELCSRQLVGEWHYVNSRAKKRLIVLCHGYESSGKDSTIVAVAKGLNEIGYDTCAFTFSANTGGFDIEHQVGDIAQLVEYFKDYEEIVLLAASFGALTAAIATIHLPKVTGLITLNGFFGRGQLGEKYRRTYQKFRIAALVVPKYHKIWRYFQKELRPELITVPVLVIHTKVDKHVFMQQSQTFYNKLKAPKQFVTLKTANHGLTSTADRKTVISNIDVWLKNKA